MRNHGLLTLLALVTLVAAAAGTALAGGPGDHSPARKRGDDARSQHDDDGNHTAANKSANHSAAKARHAELKAAREAALERFHENRTAALSAYHAAHNATKASFLENKTRVIEACQAAKNATRSANATRGNESGQPAHAKCVQDGLKPLIEKARAEHQAAKDKLQERLKAARQAAMESFRAHRADADARHGHHRSG